MTQHKTMVEKGNKSIWTLDSEAAKRIFQLAVSLRRSCLSAAGLLVGKSDWPETQSTADEMIVVIKGLCGPLATKLFR